MASENFDEFHVQAKFMTKLKKYDIGTSPFSLPGSAGCSQLNALVKEIISSEKKFGDGKVQVEFDFLIGGEFLRTTVSEFISGKAFSTESVIDIEYILKEDSPKLDTSLQHDDWISSVDLQNRIVLTGTYDNIVSLWNLEGKCITAVEGHTKAVKSVSWINFSEDGGTFLSASQDQTVLIWIYSSDASYSECKHICRGHAGSVDCLAVQPSAEKFASGSWDKMIKIWEAKVCDAQDEDYEQNESGKKKKSQEKNIKKATNRLPLLSLGGHKEPVSSISWTNDTELISGGWDHCIRLWDVQSGTNKHTLTGNKVVLSISYSLNNQLVASGSADKYIRLWDIRTSDGMVVKSTLSSHQGWVSGVVWSTDNDYQLTSVSYDESVKIWDTRNVQTPLYDLEQHSDKVMCLCWKDNFILTGGADCRLHIYKNNNKSPTSSEE